MKNTFLIVLITIFGINTFSQNEKKSNFLFTFSPQHVFTNALKVNFVPKLGDSTRNTWLSFSPHCYVNAEHQDYKTMIGIGADLHLKKFLYESNSVYFEYGLGFSYFDFLFDNVYVWAQNTESINNVIEYVQADVKQQIHKYSGDIKIGYETIFKDYITLDMYLGVGMRYSKYYSEQGSDNVIYFNDTYWDYGFIGIAPLIGVNVGVYLR